MAPSRATQPFVRNRRPGRQGLALPQSVTVMLSSDRLATGTSHFALPGGERRSGSARIIVWCTRPDAVAVPRTRDASTGCVWLFQPAPSSNS